MARVRRPPARRGRGGPAAEGPAPAGVPSTRELIVVARQEAGLRATREGVTSLREADVSPLNEVLASEGVTLEPLFGVSEERLRREASALASERETEVPDLSKYYRVEAPTSGSTSWRSASGRASWSRQHTSSPRGAPGVPQRHGAGAGGRAPVNPNFTARQGYLDAAPGGIDARHAWTLPGGGGPVSGSSTWNGPGASATRTWRRTRRASIRAP
jgi:hypothetical protein